MVLRVGGRTLADSMPMGSTMVLMQETAPRGAARKVSMALLIVLLLGQALVVLVTIAVVGLGHGSAGQAAILFGGVGAASVVLVVLLAAAIRGTRSQ
jgi:hypothetical protein